ncbi:MAG: polyisoprenoid-binding protein YceI [Bacteroidia bacterium]|jgi:polyisoprenoid-binding protein YceI
MLNGFTLGTPWIYSIDPVKSPVEWRINDSLVLKGSIDTGYAHSFMGTLFDGLITFDMAGLNAYDLKQNLFIHGQPVFNTSKYPLCSLAFTKGEWDGYRKYRTTGVLTLKDISKPIHFTWKRGIPDTTRKSERSFYTRLIIDNESFDIAGGNASTILEVNTSGTGQNF